MSKLEVNAVEPQCGTNLTLGASGDTIIIPSGATISNQGTAAGFGPTGAVSWDTTKKTTGFTAVSGVGYFCDTTSAAFTVTLPATPSAGAVVGLCDYANTFATNNITVARNGSKIGGATENAILSVNGISVTFVYVDATQGWIVTDSGNRSDLPGPEYIVATGGTITTCGDYKIHSFTGPGTFTVTSVGNPGGSNSVDYLVVAGGGGGGSVSGGAGGAGGTRYGSVSSSNGLPVTAQGYPITVGGGGNGSPCRVSRGCNGSPSIFSTITSTAGGGGGSGGTSCVGRNVGLDGGSGGGGSYNFPPASGGNGGTGNTPPTSPSQGNNGGAGTVCGPYGGGGGGSATAVGGTGSSGGVGGAGFDATPIFGSSPKPFYGPTNGFYGGGGGGGAGAAGPAPTGAAGGTGGGSNGAGDSPIDATPATINTGGGGGGGGFSPAGDGNGGNGGSGIVLIRYKFQ